MMFCGISFRTKLRSASSKSSNAFPKCSLAYSFLISETALDNSFRAVTYVPYDVALSV